MKKALMVTSVIDTDNSYPLTYSQTRSFFSNEERLRQTISTICMLDHICDEDTTIFLVDASERNEFYKNLFRYQKNLIYVDIKEEFPEVYKLIRTHKHKSYCEMIMQLTFLEKYKEQLSSYDYIFKISGRYFFDSSVNFNSCTVENTDKFLFKYPMEFEWDDNWGYSMVDRRAIQQNNKLRQYSSVIYGWGKNNHNAMLDIFRVVAEMTDDPKTMHYDIETLLYYFTRQYVDKIIEHNWHVYGFIGVNGKFLRY